MVEMTSTINSEITSSSQNISIHVHSEEKSTFERAIIEAFKQKASKQINEKLSIALDEIKFTVIDVKSSGGTKFVLNKNIVDKLSRIIQRKYFNVNILIAKIFESLLDIANFPILSNDVNLLIIYSNEVLNLLDKIPSTVVSRQLEKKCSSFLSYMLNSMEKSNLDDEQKAILKDLLNSFPTRNSSEIYKNFESSTKDKIIRLCRSQNVEDKLEGINILMESFGNTASLEEQFDILLEHGQHIIKAIIYQPNPEHKEVYFQLGNFLCSMLFSSKFKIDAFIPENKISQNELSKNYFHLLLNDQLVNENIKGNASFLHNIIFELTTQKDILSKCENIFSISNLILNTLSIYESVFDLQFVCYIILKRIYFTFPQFRKSIEDTLAMTLVNLCSFKEKFERENNEECRQFLQYLLQRGEEDLKSKLRKRIESKGVGALIEPDLALDNSSSCQVEYENLRFADFNLRIGYPSSSEIEAGAQIYKYIEIPNPNSLVYIGFATQANDITAILLKYIPEEDINAKQSTQEAIEDNEDDITDKGHFAEILKLEKINSSLTPVKIVLFVQEPGTYKLIFDNTYSWMTGKSLRYRLSVLRPLSEVDISRRIDFGKNISDTSRTENKNTTIISTESEGNKININTNLNPLANKILTLKFEGKNRAFNLGRIFQKIQKIKSNSLYLTIPVIMTNQSIRVIKAIKLEHGENKVEYQELLQENEGEKNLQEAFESKISEYLKSLNFITENHTIFLNTFIVEKSLPPNTESTTNILITSEEFSKYVYNKLSFYPEKLIKTFQPGLKFSALNLADSCLLYMLFLKVIDDEHFNSIIHIHFDKYKAQASLFSEGIIHEKISGLNYDHEKPLTQNVGNVMDFINRVTALFGGFDLSVSFSDIDSNETEAFYKELTTQVSGLEIKINLEKNSEMFLVEVLNFIQLFHMND